MSSQKLRDFHIAVLANADLGGTEKAASIYAAELARRGHHVDYLAEEGPRIAYLLAAGVKLIRGIHSASRLREYIESARPHLIHQHVPGYPFGNLLYPALTQLRNDAHKPKVIETNVFGRLEDPDSETIVDFRFFISMASAAQAFHRAGVLANPNTLSRQSVLYYPVSPPENSVSNIDKLARYNFRMELGVHENEVLAVRIGRPTHKWAAWECQAYAVARRRTAGLRLFLMEPPSWLARKIIRGDFGDGIIVRKQTSDFEWLEELYASADLMIHASDWGESFGYTIAEGMAAELPVITRSTPWCDNAQVELVKNRETGFICWSVPEMARRLIDLTSDEKMRQQMGAAAQKRILALADVQSEIDILDEVIGHLVSGKELCQVPSRNAQLIDFSREFTDLESETSERFSDHPIDFAAASMYFIYRCARSSTRAVINRIGRGQIGWEPLSHFHKLERPN